MAGVEGVVFFIRMLMNSMRTSTEIGNIKMEIENIKKNQSGMKNTITEMEIKLEGINRRLHEEQDQISDLEDKASENTHSEQETKRKKMRIELC